MDKTTKQTILDELNKLQRIIEAALDADEQRFKVAVGTDVRTTSDPDDPIAGNDPAFWRNWGHLVYSEGEKTVRVDFDPPLPIYGDRFIAARESSSPGIRTLVCTNGDDFKYTWAIKLVGAGMQAWFNDTQSAFVLSDEIRDQMWELVKHPIKQALEKYEKLWGGR